jgi:fluoride exporter
MAPFANFLHTREEQSTAVPTDTDGAQAFTGQNANVAPARTGGVPPDIDRRELAAIFLGGAAGALLRVWLGIAFTTSATGWPWTIFAINVSGCFVLGCLATRLQERLPQSTYRRPLLGTGFCGAYTTFSTVQVEIVAMLDHGRYGLAAGYAIASIAAGYLAIWIATAAVRRVRVLA